MLLQVDTLKLGAVVNIETQNMVVVNLTFISLLVQQWPIQRNLIDCKTQCEGKTTEQRKGCLHKPLLSIPFDHVVIHTLHLFLRIMGLLFCQVLNLHFWMQTLWVQNYQRLYPRTYSKIQDGAVSQGGKPQKICQVNLYFNGTFIHLDIRVRVTVRAECFAIEQLQQSAFLSNTKVAKI